MRTLYPQRPSCRNRDEKNTPTAGKIDQSSRIERKANWVVADAVAVEPVSASKFPANRENNREF
jgi:hypothetical protein